MPQNPTSQEKPLAELTVSDITQAYDDAFDAPAKPVAGKPAAVVTPPEPEQPRDERGQFVAKPPAPVHSAYWLRKAAAVALAEDDIAAMTPDELRQAVAIETASHAREHAATQTVKPLTETPPPPEPPLVIKDEDFDPALATVLKAITARLDKIDQREQLREVRGVMNRLDGLFDADKAIFGAGPTSELDADSPERLRRDFVILQLNQLAQSGRKTTLAKDYGRLKVAFGAVEAAPEPAPVVRKPVKPAKEPSEEVPPSRNRLATREEDWEEQTVERPTHREKPVLRNGVAKAKQTFADGANQLALREQAEGGGDENDELPG